MSKGKYLIGDVKNGMCDITIAVCFPQSVSHYEIAAVFNPNTIVAGGFFWVTHDGKVEVGGKSVGCNVESRPDIDERLISRALGLI